MSCGTGNQKKMLSRKKLDSTFFLRYNTQGLKEERQGAILMMEAFVRRGYLFDLYGGLLKENQRRVYAYHVIDDMSFTEIGEEMGISRQAAQELFNRCDKKLEDYEKTLGLWQKLDMIRTLAEQIRTSSADANVRTLAGEIINGI